MSSSTWTPAALSSEAHAQTGVCWRLVEAQHHVSTLKVVDDLDEQKVLEDLIEATKPIVPPECRHLDYLLFTPFRYGTYRAGSRFRRGGMTEGVFYAAETPQTAVAEIAFWRLLFFAESPATPWPANPSEHTAFSASYASKNAIDLDRRPFARRGRGWCHPTDYTRCQDLADTARKAGIEIIRYMSVRDPGQGFNLAMLTCRVFTQPRPIERQTWRLHLSAAGVQAICEVPKSGLTFDRMAFAVDPRIAALAWDR